MCRYVGLSLLIVMPVVRDGCRTGPNASVANSSASNDCRGCIARERYDSVHYLDSADGGFHHSTQ